MAASLSSDGRIWAWCCYGGHAIWRYPNGKMWRTSDMNSTCADSYIGIHVPEM